MTTQNNSKPVVTIRVFPIEAAIWRNETSKGPFHTVTFSRSYKDDNGDYHNTDSYSGPQLLQLSLLAQKAFDRAEKLTREARASLGQEGDDDNVRENYDLATGVIQENGVTDAPAYEQI